MASSPQRQGLAPFVLSLLRIVAALMLAMHGTQKLFGWPIAGPGELDTQMRIGAMLEAFGGLVLLLGLFTRPVAFVLSGMMAVAYLQFHASNGLWPLENNGELAALYCFVFLYLAVAGGGSLSVDAAMKGGRGRGD